MQERLTRHPEGTVRELLSISFPLMISSFASLLMIFTDRLFLARYSLDALNAAVNSGTLAWALIGGTGMITAMSEVFVAQYNGARQSYRIGIFVWQMLWFAFFSFALFLLFALIAPYVFQGDPNALLEATYFRWLMLFGPSYAMMSALSGFLIGRGKTKILIALSIGANCINVILDRLFIFGYDPYIPEMGIKGAAIATSIGSIFQVIVLIGIFFAKKNRETYNTIAWTFQITPFLQCIRIGLPQGIFYGLEIFGWAIFYWMMTSMSKTHITIASICQSFIILLSFFFEGLSKGIAAVAGNFIGSERIYLVYRALRSAFILQLVFSFLIAFFFFSAPKNTIDWLFFESPDSLASPDSLTPSMRYALHLSMIFTLIYIFCEGIRWIFSGFLSAAGDTLFLLIAGSITVWVALLLPVYLIVVKNNLSVEYALALAFIYSFIASIVYGYRFKLGHWKKINLFPHQRVKGTESVTDKSPKN